MLFLLYFGSFCFLKKGRILYIVSRYHIAGSGQELIEVVCFIADQVIDFRLDGELELGY